jgi:hypothetical protein
MILNKKIIDYKFVDSSVYGFDRNFSIVADKFADS